MKTRDMNDLEWEPCVVLGVPAIFTEYRVSDGIRRGIESSGKYDALDVRHSEDDFSLPCQLTKHVVVNRFGTVVVPKGSIDPEPNDDAVWFEDHVTDLYDAFVSDDYGNTSAFTDENRAKAEALRAEVLADFQGESK